jgi:hypothetical protein
MDEILVSASHGRGRPAVIGLESQFFVIWTDVGDQDLKGARFDASGTRRDDFVINTTKGIFGLPAVERIPGGFVVTWIAFPPSKLLFQRFDEGGRKLGPEIIASDVHVVADLERTRGPAIAALSDGNFVLAWVAAPSDSQIHAAAFSGFDGGRIGSEFSVNASEGFHSFPTITAFRGVGSDDIAFAVAWSGGEPGRPRSRFQMFNIDRTKAGPEVLPAHRAAGEIASVIFFPQNVSDPREFFSVLSGTNGNEEQILSADLFVRNGTSLGTNITHRGDQTVNFEALVKSLPNGCAVVTWTQKPVPTTGRFGNSMMAAILEVGRGSADFIRDNPRIASVNTTPAAGQHSLSASPMVNVTGSFRIAFAWVDARIDGSQSAIKARVLSSVLT